MASFENYASLERSSKRATEFDGTLQALEFHE